MSKELAIYQSFQEVLDQVWSFIEFKYKYEEYLKEKWYEEYQYQMMETELEKENYLIH